MTELDDLYQDVLIDHSRHPHNHRMIADPTHQATGHNPLCGDQVTVYLAMPNNTIEDISFEGQGCAICIASASLMTRRLRGTSADDAKNLFTTFHQLLTGNRETGDDKLGEPQALQGVARYPMRVKCATLPWHTFDAALQHRQQVTVDRDV